MKHSLYLQRQTFMHEPNMNIGMVGLGKLGKPVLEFFSEEIRNLEGYLGSNFYGYDIVKENRDSIHYTTVDSIEELCEKAIDIIFVAVPTQHHPDYDGSKPTSDLPPKNFDTSIVKNVLKEISKYQCSSTTVVIISTVLPGTVREEFEEILPEVIYNPYFIAMGTVKWDMLNPEMIVIGVKDKNDKDNYLDYLLNFYEVLYSKNKQRIIIGNWEEAESIKVFYNTYISTKISFVNMIMDVSMRIGNMDSKFVCKTLADSTYRLISDMYMKPGIGDGGPCHPRDNIALSYLSEKYNMNYDFFGTVMQIREKQAENIANKLVEIAKENNYNKIVINGKSYKEGVPLEDGSYCLLIGYYCEKLGYPPTYIDPINNETIIWSNNNKYVILLAHKKLYSTPPNGSLIVDLWDNCSVKKI